MSSQKPSIPKGTRDFSPSLMVRRNFIFDTIRNVFQLFGYQPIETPAMENLSTLMGKYGEEGDKLLFKILNSGNFLDGYPGSGIPASTESWQNQASLAKHISEKGLRYDLTVPFARFVVQHQNELSFPFKRYQIQPVWRADRPQKGRYREFFQCDVDVIGSKSLLNEVELVQIIDSIFQKLGIRVLIRINNRKVLAGIAESIGAAEYLTAITMAMDKLEKAGLEKVKEEMIERGISSDSVEKLIPLLNLQGEMTDKFDFLGRFFTGSEIGRAGMDEVIQLMAYLDDLVLKNTFEFDITLARGLNYYTGTIIEVKALDVGIGSVCGGGRYDDLTGIFGLPGMSGVGISFGADRIYDVMFDLNLFPPTLESTTKVLLINFGGEEEKFCINLTADLRSSGISAEMYPDRIKLKKQMEYAHRKKIPFVVLAGEEEIQKGQLTLKDMETGNQVSIPVNELKKKWL